MSPVVCREGGGYTLRFNGDLIRDYLLGYLWVVRLGTAFAVVVSIREPNPGLFIRGPNQGLSIRGPNQG